MKIIRSKVSLGSMIEFELVLFDCDGVLVDSEMIASRELAAYLAEQGIAISPEESRKRFTGCSLKTVHDKIETEDGVTLPTTFEEDLRARDRAAFERDLKPIPGVRQVLERLTIAKCVASSGSPEKIRHSLTHTGLIGFFHPHLFSAQNVARGKPAPDLFLWAANEMNADPKRCLVIEDSPVGIEAALAAGMQVIGFSGGSHCGDGYAARLKQAGATVVCETMNDIGKRLTD